MPVSRRRQHQLQNFGSGTRFVFYNTMNAYTTAQWSMTIASRIAVFLKSTLRCAAHAVFVISFAALIAPSICAQTNILTHHYDTARTGQNLTETKLTPTNVSSTTFGKLFALPVDGYVYAQPLYVSGVTIPGKGTHNVVYIATEHDSLYAFDADAGGPALWQVSFLINGATTLSTSDVGNTQDINPEIGITGTPVIDSTTNTLYVVVNTKENGAYIYRLHAIDITTGSEKFNGPVVLNASVPGTSPDSKSGSLAFNVQWENQRPGLLLLNGYVYSAYSSHGDNGPWHGWILSYNASTLAFVSAWCTSPNGKGNGIWGSGSGIAADGSGNIYVSTGNGDDTVTVPAPPPSTTIDYGDSIVRASLPNGVITPTDYFTPYNQSSLDNADTDVGSGGVLVLPDQPGAYPHILVEAGKQGNLYVIDRDLMTNNGSHYCDGCSSDPEILQTVTGVGGLWSMPAYWNGNIYLWGNENYLKAYSISNGMVSASPTSESGVASDFPGATPTVSANGTTNGIVWAVQTDAYTSSGPAILRAFDATNVSQLLYASNLTSGRDTLGPAVKFVVPVVTNGKVYVGAQKEVDVFGLLNGENYAASPTMTPGAGTYTVSVQVTISSSTPNSTIYYTTDGSTPSTASTLYTGPLTLTTSQTINAIAVAPGFIQSTAASNSYVISTQTPTPIFTPPSGSYATAQTVTITDGLSNAVIYYTTDGSTPTHGSPIYTGPITVSNTETIRTLASAPPLSDSPVTLGSYTIATGGTTTINFGLGFSNQGCMQFNGSTGLDDSRLQLTSGQTNQAGSAFCTTEADIRAFSTDFTFQLSDAQADGITFTIQNSPAGAKALGQPGGALGYGAGSVGGTGGIANSVAVKFDLYNNDGEGDDSTGMFTDGAAPFVPAEDMTASGVDLHSGDTMAVHMTYDGTTLTMTITDAVVNASFTYSWPINIPSTVGSDFAYVGFSGGTGGETASQKIESWTWVSIAPAISQQWSIVTTSETVPNAAPLTDGNGNPYPCSGQSPDNNGDSNPDCYNPLTVTTDWKVTPNPTSSTVAAVLANTFTSSNCTSSITSFNVTGYSNVGSYSAVITMGFQSGDTITFTGASSTASNQFSGSFTSTGSCMAGDSGTFTATLFPPPSGSYSGSFESSTGAPPATVQMTLSTDSNFNVTGSFTPATGAAVCFSNLTVATPLANSYGTSIASGDILETYASDASGNVVAFIMSNTDGNGAVLPNDGLFVTYIGLAGTCTGISGTDVPFMKILRRMPSPRPTVPRHSPIRPLHLHNPRIADAVALYSIPNRANPGETGLHR
ncbi:MAG: chitobiase/beta-hexosaminidase C-terminal domain-containing protein [Candidatus Acidiferrales bacterium]